MTAGVWLQRSLPLLPVIPGVLTLAVVHLRARDGRAGLGSWTRPQLAVFTLLSFCVLKVATVIAGHEIAASGLGG